MSTSIDNIESSPDIDGNKSRPLGVGGRICLLVIGMTAALSLAIAWYAYRQHRESALAACSESAAAVAKTIASMIDGDIMAGDLKNGRAGPYREQVLGWIDKIAKSSRVRHIYVLGAPSDGKYPYYADSSADHAMGMQIPESHLPPEMAQAMNGLAARTDLREASEGREFASGPTLSAYCPVLDSAGAVVGAIGADYGAGRSIRDAELFGVRMGLGSLLATGLIAAAVAFQTRRNLGRPLERLAAASEKLAAGNADLPPLPTGGDELGRLGNALALTAGAIDSLSPGIGQAVNKSPESVRFAKTPAPLAGKFKQLADSVGKALTAMDNVDALVYVVDPDTHRLIYYNRRIERAHSLARARPSDLVCWKLFGDTLERPCADCKLPELLENVDAFPAMEWERFEARTRTWFHIRNSIVRWVDGRTVLFCEAQDITRNKAVEERERRQERELADAAQAAREARRAKAAFLANVSHEIRTPMNGIIGFAELAMDDPRLSAGNREHLEKIKYSAEGLLSIINDILDYSRIEAGKVEVDRMPFALGEVIERCRREIEPRAREKGLETHFYVEPFIRKTLVGDAKKLRRVLENLLSNAVKFTAKGVVKLSCTVACTLDRTAAPGMALRFEVSDSGIGMSGDQLEKVFDAFTQADEGSSRKYGGTGLGLAITRRFVELMGGELGVVSTQGIGSKFSFTLNFGVAGDGTETPVPDEMDAETKRPRFSGEVLVCEDNDINQQVIREHLERLGLTVTLAVDGQQGVQAVRARSGDHSGGKPFDLILMDIHMPVMSGDEAAARIRKDGCSTPIVALTANVLLNEPANYRRAGMDDCLGKPFRATELWACLRRHLAVRETGGETDVVPEKPAQPVSGTGDHVVDIDEGLLNAAGNRELYDRLIRNFLQDNRTRMEELTEAVGSGDRVRAHRMAHTLKTTARMIGAEALAKAAGKLESGLENGAAVPAGDLERLGGALALVLSELAVLSPAVLLPEEEASGAFDPERARLFLDRLEPLLVSGDGEALSFMAEARPMFRECDDAGRELAARIGEYDFEAALKVVGRLRDWLLLRQVLEAEK